MKKYDIEIQRTVDLAPQTLPLLEKTAAATLGAEAVALPAGFSLLLTDDQQLQQLNRDYRGLDKTTDVLSFPAGEPLPGDPGPLYLGDVAISVPQAQRQATAAGHALEAELQLLTVHGVLHLLGYDHAHESQKQKMWRRQRTILEMLGAAVVAPREDLFAAEDSN